MLIKLTENKLRNIIKESLTTVLNEVRYISSYPDFHDKQQYYIHNEQPLKNGEKIRVFHGTDMYNALKFAKNGIDGTERANRRFSYETGMNPHGLFVTTSFNKATDFFGNGTPHTGYVVLEFTVNTNDLESPVWNGQDTYFGQNSNPMPFRNKKERDIQKQRYNDKARTNTDDDHFSIIKTSDNPALAKNIFSNNENQALFFGQINPNQIKRFWVKRKDNDYKWEKYNLSQFLNTFGNREEFSEIKKNKLYLPNEDFTSIEDMMERQMKHLKKLYDKRKENGTLEKELQRYVNTFNEEIITDDDMLYRFIKQNLYPKQAIQLIGQERYNKLMGEVWR